MISEDAWSNAWTPGVHAFEPPGFPGGGGQKKTGANVSFSGVSMNIHECDEEQDDPDDDNDDADAGDGNDDDNHDDNGDQTASEL